MSEWVFEKAFAKINLALHVLGRGNDGYHQLDSVVAFADIADHLKLRESHSTSLTITGPFAANVPAGEGNIIFKALHMARMICETQNKVIPHLEIYLEKNLPVAAGIGGGSADAAAFLRALHRILNITVTPEEIRSLATSLGADIPVCFLQKPARMQGIGEIISELTINLPAAIVLINPLVPSPTQAVFQKLNLAIGKNYLSTIDIENPPDWRNDLTDAASAGAPEIKNVLAALNAEPCFSAVRMSGSGATCFGLVTNRATANAAAARLSVRNPTWWVKAASLL